MQAGGPHSRFKALLRFSIHSVHIESRCVPALHADTSAVTLWRPHRRTRGRTRAYEPQPVGADDTPQQVPRRHTPFWKASRARIAPYLRPAARLCDMGQSEASGNATHPPRATATNAGMKRSGPPSVCIKAPSWRARWMAGSAGAAGARRTSCRDGRPTACTYAFAGTAHARQAIATRARIGPNSMKEGTQSFSCNRHSVTTLRRGRAFQHCGPAGLRLARKR